MEIQASMFCMEDSKQPQVPQEFAAALDPTKWNPASLPLERIVVDKYTREAERKVKRSKSLSMKLRWLQYHIEELAAVLELSRGRAQKLEEEGRVDDPESYWNYHEELENAMRSLKLQEEALLIEATAGEQQDAGSQTDTSPSSKQSVQFSPTGPLGEYMWIEEAADYLKINLSTFRHICARREILCSKVGKRLRFRKTKLDEWSEERENISKHRDTSRSSKVTGSKVRSSPNRTRALSKHETNAKGDDVDAVRSELDNPPAGANTVRAELVTLLINQGNLDESSRTRFLLWIANPKKPLLEPIVWLSGTKKLYSFIVCAHHAELISSSRRVVPQRPAGSKENARPSQNRACRFPAHYVVNYIMCVMWRSQLCGEIPEYP